MNANTITVTPEEFVAKILPAYLATLPTPVDYFVRNPETGKLEMILSKPTYAALDTDAKRRVWGAYYWGRAAGRWISRAATDPAEPMNVALSLGLHYWVETPVDPSAKAEPVAQVTPEAPKAKREAKPKAPKPSAGKADKPAEKAGQKSTLERAEIISPAAKVVSASLPEEEIENVLRHGSGFEGGKIRIAAFYASYPCPADAKAFLKEEYGVGGHSHTFLNGDSGFVDYDAKGVRIRQYPTNKETVLSWITVHTYLCAMVKNGTYLTPEERAKYDEITKPYGKRTPPKPVPRFQYPPKTNRENA